MAWDAGAFEYGAAPSEIPAPTTPPTTLPPVAPPIAGTSTDEALSSQGPSIRQGGGEWFILGRIYLDSGTEYEASRVVIAPSWTYEARVLSWGFVDRSIPVPSGLPQLGDCRIRLADTDRKFRDLLAHQTPRRRLIELRMVLEGESEADFDPFATFEIMDAEFPAGAIEITGRDINFTWIDKRLPGLINRTNFPDLMDGIDEAFCPIIQGINIGEVGESPPIPQGCIPLPRMTLTRWAVAQHPIESVLAVYRRLPGEGAFTLQSASDYTVVTAAPQTFDGVEYTMTFLDFDVDQDDGAEVRIDAEGVNARGPFGSMPAVSGSVLRNPIDFLINMLYAVTVAETRIPRFNVDSFDNVRTILETVIDGSPAQPYYCDGCITEPITIREFLSQFLTSFELDLYVNRFAQIEVNITTETDPGRPVFSDGPVFDPTSTNSLILINSVRQRLANPTVNRLRYNYRLNYATNEFAAKNLHDNTDDQIALGGIASPPIPDIEEDIVEFRFVRDDDTAFDVARRRMEFLALGSYRIELQMPLPETFDDVELAKLIGVTHYGGLEIGGYVNQEFKTTGLTYDLDRFLLTLRGILRTPLSMEPPDECPGITGPAVLDFGDVEVFADVADQLYPAQVIYDPDDYPGQTSVRFRATFVRNNAVYEVAPVLNVVDENGTVYLTPTLSYTLTATGNYEGTVDVAITLDPVNAHTYYLKISKTSTIGGAFQVLVPRLWIFMEESDEAKLQFPLLKGTSFDLDGSYRITSATYVAFSTANSFSIEPGTIFRKDAGKFDEVDYRQFYVVADKDTAAAAVALFNKTSGLMVTGTELTIAAGDTVTPAVYQVQFEDDAVNFTSAEDMEVRGKRTTASNAFIMSADLYTKIGSADGLLCANAAQNYLRLGVSDCQDILMDRAFLYNVADWPASAVIYFEATGVGPDTLYLLDTGTVATPINPPNNITSVIMPAGTNRVRSTAVTLIDGHIYTSGGSTTPVFDLATYLIFEIEGP